MPTDSSTSPRPDSSAPLTPPAAKRGDKVHQLHGDERPDPYHWLADRVAPDVLDYLASERAYYDAATTRLAASIETLSDQMAARLAPEESEPAHPKKRFEYFHHTPPGADYEQLRRRPVGAGESDAGEVLLDPAELLGDSGHLDLGLCIVSPDERLLAYSVDITGDEVYVLRFRDLTTGKDLPDELPRTYYTGAWSADSASFFYTLHDEKYRPYQARRHRLGTSGDEDELTYVEPDERYVVEIRGTRSGDVIEIVTYCRDTSEVWLVDAHAPDQDARCVEPRRRGIEYRIEHAKTGPDAADVLFIVTNDGAVEYRLVQAPLTEPGRHNWVEVIAENPTERLYQVTAFAGHLVTTLRRECRLLARAYALKPDGSLGRGVDITSSIPGGTLELGDNELFDTDHITVIEESHLHPKRWYDVSLDTGERTQLKTQDVPSYDADDYLEELIWTTGDPAIPVTILRRRGVELDGTAPCLLYGYGAYESVFDPEFDATLTVLLDQGVVFANAHIRGGGEGGRRWWLEGKLEYKQNTFSDHIAVADFLADGLVDGDRIVTRGLSAGGLLQGAVFSQAPQRWAGVIAEVPFVDVVTTMLDGSIPLTINEWDEWGDPSYADQYEWLKAYSPVDNLPAAGTRPDLLVTSALHDPRVMVWEPAKWVAALRYSDPQWSWRCLFRVELGAGAHAGPSGRSGHVHYEAEIYAWALDRMTAGRSG